MLTKLSVTPWIGVSLVLCALSTSVRAVDVEELGEPTEVVNVLGALPSYNNHNGGQDLLDATFRAFIDFEEKLDGNREVIFETGAGTIGWSFVYEAPNTLVARADGNGGFSLAVARLTLPASVIDSGFVDVAWTYDVDDGAGMQSIGIVIEDYRAISVTMDLGGDWSGGDGAAFGVASGNLAGTGSNGGLQGDDFTSGQIDVDLGLEFYADTNFVPPVIDDDGDGLPDAWEGFFTDDPNELGPDDADADDDELTDTEEFENGTDPTDRDTDGDGFTDGEEVDGDSDPTDPASKPVATCEGVEDLDVPAEVINDVGPIPTWDNQDRDGSGLRDDREDVTFRARIDFAPKTSGDREVIFESGGATVGFSLCYEATNTLVLRAVGGGGLNLAIVRFVIPDEIIAGERFVELAWAYDLNNGRGVQDVSLFIDGVRVNRLAMLIEPIGDWTGNNQSHFGVASVNIGGDGNNVNITGGDFVSGTIDLAYGLEFYGNTLYCPVEEDTDGDGLDDAYEQLITGGVDLAVLGDGDSDADEDGLTDTQERDLGTNPTVPDSDKDGVADGREVNDLGTLPADSDTDDDGRPDGDEVDGDPATDPLDPDTDDDGFSDGVEIAKGSDPNDPTSIPPAECDGLDELDVPTQVFTTIGMLPSFHDNVNGTDLLDVSFRVFIDFLPKDSGEREVIFETGGGTIGWSVAYEAPNTLVTRAAGNGGFSLATARFLLPDAVVEAGEIELVFTYDVDNGLGQQGIALIVQGYPAAYAGLDLGGDWSGTDAANFGSATGSMAGTGSNGTIRGDAFTSGTITVDELELLGLEFFVDTLFCPITSDRDNDELPDQWENLYTPDDLDTLGEGDADEDGLSDREELERGTDPTKEDSDGDGLEDNDEVAAGSDPLVTDTDGDGLSDGDEVAGDPASDPTLADTDGDGLEDGTEVAIGSDPTDENSPVVISDSVADWSLTGTQSENGWYSGFYNLTLDVDGIYSPEEFVEFTNSCGPNGVPCDEGGAVAPDGNHWTGTDWDKTTAQTGPWSFLGQENVHPNGTNSAPNEEEWVIRRWVADEARDTTVFWHVRKTNLNGAGVTARLFHNGDEIDFASIAGGNGVGVVQFVDVDLDAGDTLDLALTPVGPGGDTGDGSDGSATWMRVFDRLERKEPGEVFRRGDADDNGQVQLTDAINILGFLFQGTAAPTCLDAADGDDNGQVQLTDAIAILGFLFQGAAEPPAPGPSGCGEDPSDDTLDCQAYTNCE